MGEKGEKKQESAFRKIKELMSEDTLLEHYNAETETVLECDASATGIGAVLKQRTLDGKLKPVVFASRRLTSAERGYAQIDREALAIVFGVKKFRQYLLGKTFTLRTDHQPLVRLFRENKGVPQLAASRIKRWALILAAYRYNVEYITSKDNVCADYLSRASISDLPSQDETLEDEVMVINSTLFKEVMLSAKTVAMETHTDKTLGRVLKFTREGWPTHCPGEDLKHYYLRRDELTVEQGCLLWGARVIIPNTLRPHILLDLHSEHLGIVKMKALARQHFWWPNLDRDIEDITKHCISCQENAPRPNKPPVATWNWPSGPWKRIHLDFAGPFMGSTFLIIVDSYSKWLEVLPMRSTTSYSTITQLRKVFATFGLPEHIVTDNGPQFTSR